MMNERYSLVSDFSKVSGSSLQTYTPVLPFSRLVALFGPPNSQGDGYKVSTEWVLEEIATGDVVTIYDWKETSLYDGFGRTPDELRTDLHGTQWHIGAYSKEPAERLVRYITTQPRP